MRLGGWFGSMMFPQIFHKKSLRVRTSNSCPTSLLTRAASPWSAWRSRVRTRWWPLRRYPQWFSPRWRKPPRTTLERTRHLPESLRGIQEVFSDASLNDFNFKGLQMVLKMYIDFVQFKGGRFCEESIGAGCRCCFAFRSFPEFSNNVLCSTLMALPNGTTEKHRWWFSQWSPPERATLTNFVSQGNHQALF